jgi:hypothetical protein
MRRQLKFRQIAGHFAVCRLPANASVPPWATAGIFISITRTADELSIVCPLQDVPAEHRPEVPWVCFKLEGPFDFLQVGILASFIAPLAENGVPIFAISTYDTDYVLVREDLAGAALGALQEAGHELTSEAAR